MSVAKKWVFPIIRILIFAAVAAALVKIAFFAAPETEAGPETPTGVITEPQVAVATGTILNDVAVSGTVSADPAQPVRATLAGEVTETTVAVGATVAAGDHMLTIRQELPPVETPVRAPVVNDDGTVEPTPAAKPAAIKYKTVSVTAPAAGVVSSMAVIKGQLVAVGDAVGQVAPPSFSVSGTLAPDQLYRLLNQPTSATVTVTGGPAPFACGNLKITTALAGEQAPADGSESPSGAAGGSGTAVTCTVPPEVKVFNGLQAKMSIPGGVAENVLMVPVTAVEGIAQAGNAYFVLPDGTSEVRPIVLGLNDGVNVQVVSGLAEGDMVLQFVPGAPEANPDIPDGCVDMGNGGFSCEGSAH